MFKLIKPLKKKKVAMDEINFLIFHGCKVARDLELNLQNGSNEFLLKSCDEIIRIFSAARVRLNNQGSTSYGRTRELQMPELGEGLVQEWLRYGDGSQAMGLLLPVQVLAEGRMSGMDVVGNEVGERDGEGRMRFGGGEEEAQQMELADSGMEASSLQRSRRRISDVDKRTVMVAAPRIGHTEIPPEDGYTWRKYGQKEILESRFPRGYYRCTYQKLYQCQAKKQVQRLDDDPFTFQVIYRGDHTCHMTSTTSASYPVPTELMPPVTQQITNTASSVPLRRWLSTEFGLGTNRAGTSSTVTSGVVGAGPSTVRLGRDLEFQVLVSDLADAMFNSGSSSNNSMDLIFYTAMEDKI